MKYFIKKVALHTLSIVKMYSGIHYIQSLKVFEINSIIVKNIFLQTAFVYKIT